MIGQTRQESEAAGRKHSLFGSTYLAPRGSTVCMEKQEDNHLWRRTTQSAMSLYCCTGIWNYFILEEINLLNIMRCRCYFTFIGFVLVLLVVVVVCCPLPVTWDWSHSQNLKINENGRLWASHYFLPTDSTVLYTTDIFLRPPRYIAKKQASKLANTLARVVVLQYRIQFFSFNFQ